MFCKGEENKLKFDWDASNLDHLAKHGISRDEAEQVVRNNPLELETELRNGERRQQILEETDAGRILLVVVVEMSDKVRAITAWPAKRRLRAFWLTLTQWRGHGEKTE
jgi:uncharacterized DUF497 family protein